jgi:RNA polymerase sigma-70 factor (ECF subfamily)
LQLDVPAFETLYESHGAKMKSLALNVLGSVADAEDAVQEAFLRAYRSRQSYRGGAALWTWFYRILLNTCYDMLRQRGSRHTRQEVEPDEAVLPESPAGDHPLRVTLQKALADLSPAYRDVFLLFEVEGYTHREIAGMLDIPEGTSKFRLFDAKRRLKAAMRDPARAALKGQ